MVPQLEQVVETQHDHHRPRRSLLEHFLLALEGIVEQQLGWQRLRRGKEAIVEVVKDVAQ